MFRRILTVTTAAPSTLRFGILGAARIAPKALITPVRQSSRASITAVAARDPERARRFAEEHGIPAVEDTYGALLARCDVDAVYIALPASLHAEWTIAALRAQKHVLCEKPFAGNAVDAAHMVAAARDHRRVLVEAFHYRFHPLAHRIRAVLDSGEIGRVVHASAAFDASIPNLSDIRHDYALGGGALMDLGCYTLHWVRLAIGEEPTVTHAEAIVDAPDVDLAMRADLVFPGGARGDIRCSMEAQKTYFAELRVTGTTGELSTGTLLAPTAGLFSLTISSPSGRRVEHVKGDSTYAHQLDAFLNAVLDGQPALTGGEDAIATMRLMDAVYQAAGLSVRP